MYRIHVRVHVLNMLNILFVAFNYLMLCTYIVPFNLKYPTNYFGAIVLWLRSTSGAQFKHV